MDNCEKAALLSRYMTDETRAISEAVQVAVDRHGGLRKAARAIGVNYAYLSRLWNGAKSNPSPQVLRKLGIVKRVTFEKRLS